MLILVSGALLSGVVGSPHCVGMCGPFVASCATVRGGQAAWHAGRLTTYAALGALTGATGAAIPGPPWLSSAVAAALTLAFAAVLAGFVPVPSVQVPGVAAIGRLVRRADRPSRLALGMVSGLMPCGLVWSALALSVGAGGWWQGAAVMVAFGVGTVPLLAGAADGVRRLFLGSLAGRRALAALVLAAGWWSVGVRAAIELRQDEVPACHQQ